MRINFAKGEALCAEEMSQKDIQFKVNEAKLQYQADRLHTEQSLANKKEELEVAKTTAPLDMPRIVELQIEVEGLEDGLKRMDALAREFNFIK